MQQAVGQTRPVFNVHIEQRLRWRKKRHRQNPELGRQQLPQAQQNRQCDQPRACRTDAHGNFRGPMPDHAHLIQAEDARKLYGPRTSGRWHTDTSWLLQPTLGAVLRAVDLPEFGGDTLWADTAAVYRALPDDLREEIDSLFVVHDFKKSLDLVGFDYPILAHPLVRTHPETGEDSLFINFSQNPSVIGWEPERSKRLIERLLHEVGKPEHQVRFKWRKNSIAFWDNRSTLHYPVYNYGDYPRRMERVLIAYDDIPHRVRRPV
ncbi:MAG: taurine catabolism dioxygenase TauD [Pseudomonas sp.]|nr:taurine catabolism dioxygenase TauD [Pseudomonas sp.]